MTGKPPDAVGAEKYKQIFHECMKVFDKHFLANTKFISSDEISIADLLAVTEFLQLEVEFFGFVIYYTCIPNLWSYLIQKLNGNWMVESS